MPAKTTEEFAYHVGATESVSKGVVTAVAAVSGAEPVGTHAGDGLPPLYETIDPEALDALFDGRGPQAGGTGDRVTFSYYDYDVTVYRNGAIEIAPGPAPVADGGGE